MKNKYKITLRHLKVLKHEENEGTKKRMLKTRSKTKFSEARRMSEIRRKMICMPSGIL